MRISIRIDQKAALLQGLELGPRAVIEITKDQAGDHWPAIVESLINLAVTPAESSLPAAAADTVAAFLEMMDQQKANDDARAAKAKTVSTATLARFRAQVEAQEAALLQPLLETCELSICDRLKPRLCRTSGPRIKSYIRDFPTAGIYEGELVREDRPEWVALQMRSKEAELRNRSVIDAANARALEEQAAVIDTYWAKADAEKAQREAQEQRAQQRILEERLQSGYWEKETDSYNRKRYSSPWCARVTFPTGPKAVYEFGESSGDRGATGVMRVPCRPGEIVAWGQKDFRNSNGTTHQLAIMELDGSMTVVNRVEAYRRFALRQQELATPTSAATPAA